MKASVRDLSAGSPVQNLTDLCWFCCSIIFISFLFISVWKGTHFLLFKVVPILAWGFWQCLGIITPSLSTLDCVSGQMPALVCQGYSPLSLGCDGPASTRHRFLLRTVLSGDSLSLEGLFRKWHEHMLQATQVESCKTLAKPFPFLKGKTL